MISKIANNKKIYLCLGCTIPGLLCLTSCYDTIPPNYIGYSNLFRDISNKKLSS